MQTLAANSLPSGKNQNDATKTFNPIGMAGREFYRIVGN
jgi:hypothetical protein